MSKINNLVLVFVFMLSNSAYGEALAVSPVLSFKSQEAVYFEKMLKVGEVELLEFTEPVSLAHYGTNSKSLDYIELEKLEASVNGYKKFMIKAKSAGTGELTFRSGKEIIKVKVLVTENYQPLEDELNRLFGVRDASPADRIKVLSANLVSNIDIAASPRVYLKGKVNNAKNALLAVAFAANAIGDKGVKIFSNPGGQLRFKDLDHSVQAAPSQYENNDSSFVEFYESTNKLIDTNNLYRDLILASENEQVISFIQVNEPSRYAIKVRFLEMDSKYVDDFLNSVSVSSTAGDIKGSLGSNDLLTPSVNRSASGFGTNAIRDVIGSEGIARLTGTLTSGNIVSGAVKLLDNTFLNVNLNNLLQEGILRVVNEFSLVTHSGETVSLGKGTRFPIPKLNNAIGNSSITVEYIPIGFKGELKVTGLENQLIDVQLASRLSSAEASATTIQGINIPIFNEEYVNSGALLADGQEVILNAFMTETETIARSSSLLGRVVPLLGRSKTKQKSKNLLFIALQAEEIQASSAEIAQSDFEIPHLNLSDNRNIYADYARKLEKRKINQELDLADLNSARKSTSRLSNKPDLDFVDPVGLKDLEF